MSNQKYSPEFKDEAVRQVLDRGHTVREVAKNLDVPAHNLYKWVKQARPEPVRKRDDELIESK
jgi:transposase